MVQLSEILDGAAEWREILEGAAPDLQSLHCLLSSSFTAAIHEEIRGCSAATLAKI